MLRNVIKYTVKRRKQVNNARNFEKIEHFNNYLIKY